jgi:programmed cell death protein 5
MAAAQDDELAALRAQRLRAMQEQLQQQAVSQLEAEEQAQQDAALSASIDSLLRRALSPDARSRIARIALVEPARAQSIKADLVRLFEAGEFEAPLSDASLKHMLTQQSKSRSNASIRRI